MRQSISLLLALLIGFISFNVTAQIPQTITFYLEDEPIYTSSDQQSPGFLLELSAEMMKIIGIQPDIQFLPWKRAQHTVINTANAIIFPLTRTDLREKNYRWICKIFDVPVMFINKDGSPVINSVGNAKKIRGIGVISGTPQEEYLRQQGVSYVSVSGSELYEKLAKGDFNVIYSAKPEALLAWKQVQHTFNLQFGKPLQTLPLWIAANKTSPLVEREEWDKALQATKESGFFDKLKSKYFGIEP